ncbi:hypothetical protein ACA30_04200 [Virgibacillus soli]|nr:hypothetical protein ACA30_04200 [Virgibacillus soli]
MKVSACVTTFNRSEKLDICLNSLFSQTMNPENFEIIVIDDCSTDDTTEMVQRLQNKHNQYNINYIRLEKNTGNASIPRNTAIDEAKGEYLIFIDSDDYLAPQTLENSYKFAKENDADIVYLKYGLGSTLGSVPKGFTKEGTQPKADIIDNAMLYSLSVLKLFKLSEIKRLNLRFDPNITIGEDMLFTSKFLFNTEVHSILADQEYYIIVHHESDRLTKKSVPIEDSFSNYNQIMENILTGTYKDETYRRRASARFIHRTLSVGRGSNRKYLEAGFSDEEAALWMDQFSSFLKRNFPVENDKYLAKQYKNQVYALREGNLLATRFAVQLEEQKNEIAKLKKVNEKVEKRLTDLEQKLEASQESLIKKFKRNIHLN